MSWKSNHALLFFRLKESTEKNEASFVKKLAYFMFSLLILFLFYVSNTDSEARSPPHFTAGYSGEDE